MVVLLLIALLVGAVVNEIARQDRLALLGRFDDLSVTPLSDIEWDQNPTSNGKPYLDAALELSRYEPSWESDRPHVGTFVMLQPQQQLVQPMLNALEQSVEFRQRLLALLLEAKERDLPPPRILALPNTELAVLDGLTESRRAGRWLEDSVEWAGHQSRTQDVPEILSGFDVLQRANQGGVLIQHLVALSIRAMACGAIENMLSRHEMQPAELIAAADIIETWLDDTDLLKALRPELSYMRTQVEEQLSEYLAGQAVGHRVHGSMPTRAVFLRADLGAALLFPDWYLWSKTTESQGYLDMYEELALVIGDSATLDPYLEKQAAYTMEEGLGSDVWRMVVSAELRNRDQVLLASIALRAEAVRMREGKWPAAIDEVPGIFGRSDWRGRPLEYRPTDDGLTLYALGHNGIDDAGLNADFDPEVSAGADDGPTFQLYHVASRNQLAPPERAEAFDWDKDAMTWDDLEAGITDESGRQEPAD